MLALTFGVFYAAKSIQRRLGWILFNPILVAIAIIIVFLLVADIPFETYHEGAKMIEFWLKPAVVALGVPLYLQLSSIKRQFLPILASQMMGCIAGIVSVVVIAKIFGASDAVIMSLASKSVTTPIAMEVTQVLGWHSIAHGCYRSDYWSDRSHHRFQDSLRWTCPQSDGSRSLNGRSFTCVGHFSSNGSRPVCWCIRQSWSNTKRHTDSTSYSCRH